MEKEYQICTRCIMDTSDRDIQFDENGFCNHCTTALYVEKLRVPRNKEKVLNWIVETLKREGKGKK